LLNFFRIYRRPVTKLFSGIMSSIYVTLGAIPGPCHGVEFSAEQVVIDFQGQPLTPHA
jgi:hypothetical protein